MSSEPYDIVCSAEDHDTWIKHRHDLWGASESAHLVPELVEKVRRDAFRSFEDRDTWIKRKAKRKGLNIDSINRRTGGALHFGAALEEPIIEYLNRWAKPKIPCMPWKVLLRSKEHPCIGASPDGIAGTRTLIEIKAPCISNRRIWACHGVPLYYVAQCQQQMYVTGAERVIVAAMFGNRATAMMTFDVERDDRFIAMLVKHAVSAWQEVKELRSQSQSQSRDKANGQGGSG